MPLQLLIATVNSRHFQRDYTPPFDNHLIINQTKTNTPPTQPTTFNYPEKGLSKSRNRALQHATADLCLLSDDDIHYAESAQRIVIDAFNANPSADIITFQTQTPDGALFNKRYPTRHRRHTRRTIMRVTSYEIAFRTASIRAAGLRFDERFGLGADFPTGEENIFLLDALRHGLKLYYVPAPIAVHPACSSGSDFHNPELIAAKGAMFHRMFGAAAWLVSLAFACKKYRLSPVGCRRFYALMCRGIAAHRKSQ